MQSRFFVTLSATAVAAALVIAAPAHAQAGSPEDSTIKDTANKVTEPFDGKEAPAKLIAVQGDPYSLAGLRKCAAIQQEIVELDEVLGPDVNETEEESRDKKRERTAGRVAGSVAGSIIPFRSLIGEITGANAERRRYAEAVYAGTVRRGFLKGVGLERGCKAPARP
ncbi:MAG TPA: hypothetical protein VGN68_07715 [Sphingopyxis sp.]|jgi:hypothetical protein|uniref:hypothetical protein n=1 Tax=Sphingopyxis sp. TaxID=1908224 RepID=UPI002E13EAD3|nr:hypothetical protein [Sphingopyxis sp.]